jgi:hypothetical protein
VSEPTKDDLEKAQEWLQANAAPDPYGSWRLFEKSTIRLRHDIASLLAQAREEGRIAGLKEAANYDCPCCNEALRGDTVREGGGE